MSDGIVTTEEVVESSPLGMSDDAFAHLDPNDYPVEADPVVTEEPEGETDDAAEQEEAATDAASEDDVTDESDDEDTDTAADDVSEEAAEPDAESEPAEDVDKTEAKDEKAEVDYKSEYEKLFAPFRANGKDMTVGNIDDARQLMQMGANYNKKMAALKPSLKTLKLLENNKLLDESKLSYLIDLHKGDKGAIQKLIKDSGIDPLDMDVEADSDYEPKTYTVDDREMALDEVLERIQDTPTYSETVNVVSNKWDRASKQMVADKPDILEAINNHMASGIYERVNAEVDKERTFGRLNGLTDLEAYQKVGDSLHERGAFNDLVQTKQAKPPAEKQQVAPMPKGKTPDPKLKEKKRAASSTKAKTTAAAQDWNPLGLSDAEFEAQFNEKLL